ncbi:MAG: tRNA (adenosine(37)-N6)-dimethylallyltransferase MiaA [Lachnospiraceae bacterium]|nr:tRNA (adenosine(37)-N6)-dimethylallyltransferase MiaA [Lachnospiraceae bacterium]
MQKRPLIILTGPTAAGKTALSIGLAEALNGEIISADSMQVYRYMDIGTAKIKPGQMKGIRHYLIDELDPCEEFSAAVFKERCQIYMEEIYSRGKVPILAGGTGFYIQSVLYSVDFSATEADSSYREELAAFAERMGNGALHERLAMVDKEAAEAIHPNNVKRVIRALEYYKQTGRKISEHNEEQRKKESDYKFRYYVLSLPREILYERINRRVDLMKEEGLTQEVQGLLKMGCTREMVSMQGLGYKEIIDALEGRDTLEHAYERIKQETRHFAKRQFTWFRRERDVTWLHKELFSGEEELLQYCIKDCREYLGLN